MNCNCKCTIDLIGLYVINQALRRGHVLQLVQTSWTIQSTIFHGTAELSKHWFCLKDNKARVHRGHFPSAPQFPNDWSSISSVPHISDRHSCRTTPRSTKIGHIQILQTYVRAVTARTTIDEQRGSLSVSKNFGPKLDQLRPEATHIPIGPVDIA